jgi:hypothetical protein
MRFIITAKDNVAPSLFKMMVTFQFVANFQAFSGVSEQTKTIPHNNCKNSTELCGIFLN